jgi:mRNA-degrading endonuclease RelE of RelBE toxin-antitoxin system
MQIVFTNVYIKKISKLLDKDERQAAENEIAKNPLLWPVIRGTGGIRKARAKRGTSGKSGGIRIIYYFLVREESIYMLTAYSKNEQEDLSASDKKLLRNIIKDIKGE